MASTNLIAHIAAGIAFIYLIWLCWQEKRNATLLRILYRPDRDWMVAVSGTFFVNSLVAAGIDHEYEVLSREPQKLPLKTLALWIQMLPKGAKLHFKRALLEIHLPKDNRDLEITGKIEDLKKISDSLESAFGLKFTYLMESKHV